MLFFFLFSDVWIVFVLCIWLICYLRSYVIVCTGLLQILHLFNWTLTHHMYCAHIVLMNTIIDARRHFTSWRNDCKRNVVTLRFCVTLRKMYRHVIFRICKIWNNFWCLKLNHVVCGTRRNIRLFSQNMSRWKIWLDFYWISHN